MPRHVVNIAWSFAALAFEDEPLSAAIAAHALGLMDQFNSQALANTAWAFANLQFVHEPLLQSISQNAVGRLAAFHQQDLQNTAWAFHALKFCNDPLLTAISQAFRAHGRKLDLEDPPGHLIAEHLWRVRSNDPWEPWLSLLLPGMAAVMKPAAWQVDTDDVGIAVRRLTRWVQRRFRYHPVSQSHHHRYGIIHRLDTPSSGLIAVGRTFEGYFSLMFQLSTGQLDREYVVLSFHLARAPAEVSAKLVLRKEDGPSLARVGDGIGKTATTWLNAAAHVRHTWPVLHELNFSLLTIKIGTGRRHQIRTHTTHIGHPTVMDAKYSAEAVWEPEPLRLRQFPQDRKYEHSVSQADIPVRDSVSQPPKTRTARSGVAPRRCWVCGETGHWVRDCPNGGKDRCLVCGEVGHQASECLLGARCGNCGRPHLTDDCPAVTGVHENLCYDYRKFGRCSLGRRCHLQHSAA